MGSRMRMAAFVLLLVLLVPVLAACGGGNNGGSSGTGGTSATSGAGAGGASNATASTGSAATAAPAATADTGSAGGAATAMPEATTGTGSTSPTAASSGSTGSTGAVSGATAGASGDITKIGVEDGATITVVVNGNPTEQKLYQDGVARFNQALPNVKVNVQVNNDQYETNMKAAFAAGTGPDVLLLPSQLLGAFQPEGLLLPLDDAMSAAGVQKSDYVDALINLFTIDGKVYGVPKDFNPLVVFINTDMAQKAGVDPASIKTWDDLKSAAQKMTTGEGASKQFGMCLNPDIERIGASMLQNNNPIIKDNKAVFNDASGAAAVDFWYGLKQAGSGELYKQMGKGWCGEAFSSRTAAMAVEGGWIIPFLADPNNKATDLKYTAIPMPIPQGGKQATWLFTNGFGVNAKTKYPKAAAALALFLTSAANQKALIPAGLAQPSLKELANDPYYQQNAVAKTLVEQGPTGQLSDTTLGGPIKKGDVISKMNSAIEAIFLGQASSADALNSAAQDVDSVLQAQ